ncbi:hypothetical protein E2P84_22325 [Burkholderia cepacia]|uniref:Uncharacterized protein n=1 Tax=Burkholderia cepacia TaxID=292 RepID=A0AAX2RGD9_BURCE|nr:hypothetical protein [Burkholderia cepacia]TES73098.1 hypothetical protein E2P84_22325 [Burkholderia cepacia]TES99215.1 hypothetical protein E3D36_26320 [Burkholderia cepacia]TEU40043.1 hypothetical protein E3D37_29275 [Burkholderia cepacia]TEU46881.1 hypothetical protein E3D38_24280 [Burkholderia cepacia]TEU93498.1 hypothetical protein E3D40_27845 [Burkholderia cepacia]
MNAKSFNAWKRPQMQFAELIGRIFVHCTANDVDNVIARVMAVHPEADAASEPFEYQMRGVGCIDSDTVVNPEYADASVGHLRCLLKAALSADGITEWKSGTAAILLAEPSELPVFDVQFEDVGFTSSNLTNCEICDLRAQRFTETAISEKTLPERVVAIVRGCITEDDNQDGSEKKVFVCVTLRVRAENDDAAENFRPPKALLTTLADMMARETDGGVDLSLEGNWEASVGSAELVSGSPIAAFESLYDGELCIRAAKEHGENSEPDHEVGDLQDYLRDMWKLLTPEQREAYFNLDSVLDRLELGLSSEEFDSLRSNADEARSVVQST